MSKNTMGFFVDGTAALKPQAYPGASDDAAFVAFRGSAQRIPSRKPQQTRQGATCGSLCRTLKDVFDRSEMACSLLYEDVRGVSYDMLSKANVATVSIACAAIAIISIAFGA